MAYGSASGVGSYCRTLASVGVFTQTTNPTLSAVQSWLDQISSMLDNALSASGFVTPLENETAIYNASIIVEMTVADMAKGANSTGRFFTDKMLEGGQSMWSQIASDMKSWVELMSSGLEAMGVDRSSDAPNTVAFKEGDTSFAIMQRNGFGNTFTDWTKE